MNSRSQVKVETVSWPRQWNEFFRIRHELYRHDPCYVRPLKRMERLLLDTVRHPFYQHATREVFIAVRDGQTVGRIAAIVDHDHNRFHQDSVGFFGFFESIDDPEVAGKLLESATEWLKYHGCDRIRGPVNPSMKSEFGVLVEGNQSPPFVMMAHTLPYYEALLLASGLKPIREFYAYRFNWHRGLHEVAEKWKHLDEAAAKIHQRYPSINFPRIDRQTWEQTLREVNHLGNKVRSQNWGFVPLTDAELDFMIDNLRRVIRMDMIHVACWEDRMIGFIVNLPDVNEALRNTWGTADWVRMAQLPGLIRKVRRARVIALGVDPEFRNKGVAMLLIKKLVDTYDEFDEWELSWVDQQNVRSIRSISRVVPLRESKIYRIYEKPI